MEKGLYDGQTNFFAPYYRQAGLNAYTMDASKSDQYFDLAYEDVSKAFDVYLKDYNQGRPVYSGRIQPGFGNAAAPDGRKIWG